jgi:flagellar secretion chaperone FliS
MPIPTTANRYREVEIKTATPLELVVMLYDAAIANLHKAQEHLAAREIAPRTRCLNKVSAILTELQANLNFEAGGSVAPSLDRLYRYMKDLIIQANLKQECAPLKEAVKLLSGLRSAWAQVAQADVRKATQASAPAFSTSMPLSANGPSASPLAGLNITA